MLLVVSFVASSYLVLGVDPEIYLIYDRGLANVSTVVGSILLGLYFQDMYSNLRIRSWTLLVQQICTAIGVAFLMQSLVNYVSPGTMIPHWLMLVGSIIALFSLFVFRVLYSTVLGTMGLKQVLFLGRSETIQMIAHRIEEHPELGFSISGYLEDGKAEAPGEAGNKRLGRIQDLNSVVARVRPEQIVVGLTERRHQLPMHELLDLKFAGMAITDASQIYEITHHRVSVRELRPSDLIFSGQMAATQTLSRIQGTYSWALGLVGFL